MRSIWKNLKYIKGKKQGAKQYASTCFIGVGQMEEEWEEVRQAMKYIDKVSTYPSVLY